MRTRTGRTMANLIKADLVSRRNWACHWMKSLSFLHAKQRQRELEFLIKVEYSFGPARYTIRRNLHQLKRRARAPLFLRQFSQHKSFHRFFVYELQSGGSIAFTFFQLIFFGFGVSKATLKRTVWRVNGSEGRKTTWNHINWFDDISPIESSVKQTRELIN